MELPHSFLPASPAQLQLPSAASAILGANPYQQLLEEVTEFAIFMTDTQGRIASWNEGARRLFGFDEGEAIGAPMAMLFTLLDQANGAPEAERDLARQNGRAEDVRWHQRKDGSQFWANGLTMPLRDENGVLVGFTKIARDETGRKRLEEEKQLFEKLAHNSPDFIGIGDLNGHLIYLNPGAMQMVGIDDLEAAKGVDARQFFFPEDHDFVLNELFPRVLSQGQAQADIRFRHFKTGEAVWLTYLVFSVPGANGQPIALATVSRDISERKRFDAEREELLRRLQFERGRLAAIYQNSPSFVCIVRGCDFVFEQANPAYFQLVGHRDIIGKPLLEALPEIEGQGFVELLQGVMRTGVPHESRSVLVHLQREPGGPLEERFVDLLYQPLLEADGTISGVFSHGVDVTDGVLALRAAENANRLKDEFLATLSHELRTPLQAILGYANLLKSGQLSDEESARALEVIERNARAQGALIEDVLDMSRILSGKLSLSLSQVDLAHCIEGALDVVRPAAAAKGIRLILDLDPGAGLIAGDANRLQQVMWNLLSNAIKFTPRGGRVTAILDRFESSAQITVHDTGQGIAPEFLPHVFDRFRQADSSSTRAHSGLGLGLSIVRQMVELHGGTIEAHSRGEGRGATFTLRFPLSAVITRPLAGEPTSTSAMRAAAALSETALALALSDSPKRELRGAQVLVVEDEADARALICDVLRAHGASVCEVATVLGALEALEKQRFDVLVSDIGMAGQDGYALIKQVRQDEAMGQQPPLPAIALTAFARAEDRVRTLQAGFNQHVPKPVEPAELVAVVRHLFSGEA